MKFGEKVKLIRESRNLSTTKLAKMAGMAQSTLRDIELCKATPNYTSVEKIYKALDMDSRQFENFDSEFDEDSFNKELLGVLSRFNNSQKKLLLDFIRSVH